MQRTLKRESKVLEIVKRETIEAFHEEKDTFHGRRERTSLRSGAPRRRPVRDLRRRGVGRAFLFTGGPAAASRFEQFRRRERIRRPGGSASVGTGGNGLREGGAGFRSCVRTARGDRPPSSFRPRRSPRKRAPLRGREVSTSPSTRSGRLTQRLRPTRLETRTKESNVHASRVAKETKTRKASLLYPSRG